LAGFWCCQSVLADSARVLPKGRSGVLTSYYRYFDIDQRYDDNGNKEDLAEDFNTSLDSSVFPLLKDLEDSPLGGFIPGGVASFGDTDVDIQYDNINIFELEYYYGFTDKLTAGFKIPYWWVNTEVEASVDSSPESSATVGFNTLWGTPGDPYGSPVIPLALPGSRPATDDDIQDILGGGLSINDTEAVQGYGFDRFESWDNQGLSDIELSARYQYAKYEHWRHAFTGGLRLPTGRIDDPDNLVDLPFGGGVYQLLLRSNHDILGYGNWGLNLTFKYDITLKDDRRTVRVSDDVDQPITKNKARVDVDVGNLFEFDTTGTYKFTPQISSFVRYRYKFKSKNKVDGPDDLPIEVLEEETRRVEHQYQVGVAYSTVSKYFEGKTKVPYVVRLSYRDRFNGKNVLDSQYIKGEFQLFF
jgi:hypothetical protein